VTSFVHLVVPAMRRKYLAQVLALLSSLMQFPDGTVVPLFPIGVKLVVRRKVRCL
jgi:hypothetical protein